MHLYTPWNRYLKLYICQLNHLQSHILFLLIQFSINMIVKKDYLFIHFRLYVIDVWMLQIFTTSQKIILWQSMNHEGKRNNCFFCCCFFFIIILIIIIVGAVQQSCYSNEPTKCAIFITKNLNVNLFFTHFTWARFSSNYMQF